MTQNQSDKSVQSDEDGNSSTKDVQGEDVVPLKEKIGYSIGAPSLQLGSSMTDNLAKQILNMQLGIMPTYITLTMMLFRIWDAFTDPLMGLISDRTRSKWGRRRPYLVVGAFAMAITLPFVFRFNREWSDFQIMAYYLVAGIIFSTAQTIFNIPWQTVKLEMTPDYNERTKVNVYATVISQAFGLLYGWVWWLCQQPIFAGETPEGESPDLLRGVLNFSPIIAIVIFVIAIIPPFFCKERYYETAVKNSHKESLLGSLKRTWNNRPFRLMIIMILVMNIGTLVSGLGTYITTYYVCGGDQLVASKITGAGFTIASIIGLFAPVAAGWLSGKMGKERALMVILGLSLAFTFLTWFTYTPSYPWAAALPIIMVVPLVGTKWVLVPSMLADVIDYDELQTGERHEGAFSSVFSWLLKASMTAMFGLSGPILDIIGFDATLKADQAPGVYDMMKMSFIGINCIGLGGMMYCLLKYPLSPSKMAEVRKGLEKMRGAING